MDVRMDRIMEAADYVREKLPEEYKKPLVGIVCGSGLSNLSSEIVDRIVIRYSEIPNFPVPTVPGHASEMVIGKLNGVISVGLRGRVHYYEGHDLNDVTFSIRMLVLLGIKVIILTNAAGGIDESFTTGDFMVIEDHISFLGLAGISPLRGENLDFFGPRFPALTQAYLPYSFELVSKIAKEHQIDGIKRGIYVGVGGPAYETPAEVRFLRSVGGSAVGMSTIAEVIAAVHAGVKVMALSLITNVAISRDERIKCIPNPTHEEVLYSTEVRAKELQKLVYEVVPELVEYAVYNQLTKE